MKHQAIPVGGYTQIFEQMIDGAHVDLGVDFYSLADRWKDFARQLVFTGPIDRYYGEAFGRLEYRSLRFEVEVHDGDYHGHSVFNYGDDQIPYLWSIEHKHFEHSGDKHYRDAPLNTDREIEKTVVTFDYPVSPENQSALDDPQYPIRDARNCHVYHRYSRLAAQTPEILFGGRLGEYRYYDIDQAIGSAIVNANRYMRNSASARDAA